MAVATDFRAVGQIAGLAIGGTVWFEAMFAGPLCGASMNPARSLGPAALSGEWSHFSAYVLGPVLGALAGAFFYELIRCHRREDNKAKGCCCHSATGADLFSPRWRSTATGPIFDCRCQRSPSAR